MVTNEVPHTHSFQVRLGSENRKLAEALASMNVRYVSGHGAGLGQPPMSSTWFLWANSDEKADELIDELKAKLGPHVKVQGPFRSSSDS